MTPPAATAWQLRALLALGYLVFVVYGSLVPLEFRALPLDEALARFARIPFLQLGIGSRADWVANLLLFVPLTFFSMSALCANCRRRTALIASVGVAVLAGGLSVGIEFTQLFFPQRTVSQNDIWAEVLGAGLGIAIWWRWGPAWLRWLAGWTDAQRQAALPERLAWAYLAGLVLYNLMPLDLTISVVEIYHKWQEGRVFLLPFAAVSGFGVETIYELATDALIWLPLAWLWRLHPRPRLKVWVMCLGTAFAIELLQVFVYSRVTDVTDLIMAALGAGLGVQLNRTSAPIPGPARRLHAMPFVWAAGYAALLVAVFWYPFEFRTDGMFLRERLDATLQRVPFEVYYYGTEFRALTEVLHKTLFFAPLGALLAWGVAGLPWRWRGGLFALSLLALGGVPALIEVGQLAQPDKFADLTDGLLAVLGGVGGYGLGRIVRHGLHRPLHAVSAAPAGAARVALVSSARTGGTPPASRVWPERAATLAALTLLFWAGSHWPALPYNVRELLATGWPLGSAALLAVAVYGLAVWPIWLARRALTVAGRWAQLAGGLLGYGGVSFLLIERAVPTEALHDVVGSPILLWPWNVELLLRWMALACVPGSLLYLAAQTARRLRGKPLTAGHFVVALPFLLLGYWGVVAQASTDNLTELLAAPALPAFMAVAGALFSLALGAAVLASPGFPLPRRALLVAISFPLAALGLLTGLAGQIDKYGAQFSALQFLLSTDRQHYADTVTVWIRYLQLHAGVLGVLALLQASFFRTHPRRTHAQHRL